MVNREEFIEKWESVGSKSGMRLVYFDGGTFYAHHVDISGFEQDTKGRSSVCDTVYFSKLVGRAFVNVGYISLDKITDVM